MEYLLLNKHLGSKLNCSTKLNELMRPKGAE
jgi:hypothetical protein